MGLKKKKQRQNLNQTPDGGLACAHGTPWLDHWDFPTGTGEGCKLCEQTMSETSTEEMS